MVTSDVAYSDSESVIDDLDYPANSLSLGQIPFPTMVMHIFNYLISPVVNPTRPCWPWSSMSRNEKTEFRWKMRNCTVKNDLPYYLCTIIEKPQKSKQVSVLTLFFALMARFNHFSPQCSLVMLTMSAFNFCNISRWLSNHLVIQKTCLAYIFISLLKNVLIPFLVPIE